ncbi:MAG: sigma-70 family RNA polymerase sigma factor [Chloroflexi bacterium]|nr:sigma-70 family RNA polymerase sigma factor [Chloroflexota bacterium]
MKALSKTLLAFRGMTQEIDWDSVYTSELPRIYNFFLYKVGDRECAQDLTATTFERAWKLRFRYQTKIASQPTWLFGIARNVLKEYLRKNKVNGQRQEPIFWSENVPSSIDIEKSIQQQQEKDYLLKILLVLPEHEQELIALKYGAGLTNREIAKITRLSESNVGSILHRTVKELRNRLDDDHGR